MLPGWSEAQSKIYHSVTFGAEWQFESKPNIERFFFQPWRPYLRPLRIPCWLELLFLLFVFDPASASGVQREQSAQRVAAHDPDPWKRPCLLQWLWRGGLDRSTGNQLSVILTVGIERPTKENPLDPDVTAIWREAKYCWAPHSAKYSNCKFTLFPVRETTNQSWDDKTKKFDRLIGTYTTNQSWDDKVKRFNQSNRNERKNSRN